MVWMSWQCLGTWLNDDDRKLIPHKREKRRKGEAAVRVRMAQVKFGASINFFFTLYATPKHVGLTVARFNCDAHSEKVQPHARTREKRWTGLVPVPNERWC